MYTGFACADRSKNEKDLYGLPYADFVVPLVKAIQEQQQTIAGLEKKYDTLLEKFKQIEKNKQFFLKGEGHGDHTA